MAKLVFNFFEAYMEDDEVSSFLKKIEEVLTEFAGEAYHFRYYLEEPFKHDPTQNTRKWFEKS